MSGKRLQAKLSQHRKNVKSASKKKGLSQEREDNDNNEKKRGNDGTSPEAIRKAPKSKKK